MRRQEMWEAEYRLDRYLRDASIDNLKKRSQDIHTNLMGVNEKGQLSPGAALLQDGSINREREQWWIKWTHVLEELKLRSMGLTSDLLPSIESMKWVSYPDQPRGTRILRNGRLPPIPYLAKIGKREHLFSFFTEGSIRIAPASYYSDPSLNSAIRDDELTVTAVRSGEGASIRPVDKATGKLGEAVQAAGEIQWSRHLDGNFYVSCFSHTYDPRLLDDFEGDALVLITDVRTFLRRLQRAVLKSRPELQCSMGVVRYYDPYHVDANGGSVAMMKHFRYAYQKEFRVVWASQNALSNFEPFFVKVGTLRGIGQLYSLRS